MGKGRPVCVLKEGNIINANISLLNRLKMHASKVIHLVSNAPNHSENTVSTAMCFTCSFASDMFYELFHLHNTKYGIKVKTCSLCTSVWTNRLLSRIGNLNKLYWYLIKRFSTCTIEYEPELFPCITLLYKNTTVRMFHTGKN